MTRRIQQEDSGPAGWGTIPTLGSTASSTPSGTSPSATQQQQAQTATDQAASRRYFLSPPPVQEDVAGPDGKLSMGYHAYLNEINRRISGFQADPTPNTASVPNPDTTPSALASYGYTEAQANALLALAINLATRLDEVETKLGLKP